MNPKENKSEFLKEGSPEEKEAFYKFQANSLLEELKEIEYLKANKLDIVIGKVKYKEAVKPKESSIITAEDLKDKTPNVVEKIGYQLQLIASGSPPEPFYVRQIEGITEECRYTCIWFAFKDILNAGVRLNHLIYIDQKKILQEMMDKRMTEGKKIIA